MSRRRMLIITVDKHTTLLTMMSVRSLSRGTAISHNFKGYRGDLMACRPAGRSLH